MKMQIRSRLSTKNEIAEQGQFRGNRLRLTQALANLSLAFVALSYSAVAAPYTVDKDHSRVGFKIRHLVSKTEGEFKDFEGTFQFDPAKPEASVVQFTAKAESIYTNNKKRDDHLRSPDFFDVKKYPSLSFQGKKMTKTGDNRYSLEGDLTIHGVTKATTFDVEYGGEAKDPWGGTRSGFSATTKINRKDFGVSFNKTLDAGGLMLGEEVEVSLNIEAIKK